LLRRADTFSKSSRGATSLQSITQSGFVAWDIFDRNGMADIAALAKFWLIASGVFLTVF